MPEKEPQFTVTDRRKFTLEGDLREGETPQSESAANLSRGAETVQASGPATVPQEPQPQENEEEAVQEPTAEESAQQNKEYQASARQLDDILGQNNIDAPAAVPMSFDRLVQSIYMTAVMQMGAGTGPDEQPRIDIVGARQSIDMLGVLEEKTKGNLTEDEKRLLQSALFDLRMSFLEITNAIASSAQRPPNAGPTRN